MACYSACQFGLRLPVLDIQYKIFIFIFKWTSEMEYGFSLQIIQWSLRLSLEKLYFVHDGSRNINLPWKGRWKELCVQSMSLGFLRKNPPSQMGLVNKQGSRTSHRNITNIWELDSTQIPTAGIVLQPWGRWRYAMEILSPQTN